MIIKPVLDSLENIPEDLAKLYDERETDGKKSFHFRYELPADKSKEIAEFRENNIGLKKEIEGLKSTLESKKDLDADVFAKLKTENETLKASNEGKTKEIDEIIEKRVGSEVEKNKNSFGAEIKKLQEQLNGLTNERNELQEKQRKIEFKGRVLTAVKAQGALKDDMEDYVLYKAQNLFAYDSDGELKATHPDGTKKYGEDGNPYSLESWAKEIKKNDTANNIFLSNTGGGSPGSGSGNINNPGSKVLDRNDSRAISKKLEDVASGKVTLSDPAG